MSVKRMKTNSDVIHFGQDRIEMRNGNRAKSRKYRKRIQDVFVVFLMSKLFKFGIVIKITMLTIFLKN